MRHITVKFWFLYINICLKETSNLSHRCRSELTQSKLDSCREKIVDLLEQGYATSYIANHSDQLLGVKVSNDNLIFFCKRHNIARRSIKEAAKTTITRELYKNTVSNRFGRGITNVSQSTLVKEKKKQVNLNRHGVENPFQRADVKNKIKEVLLAKYGVENPIHIPDRKKCASYTRLTRPHKKISIWLTDIGIDHINDMPGKFKKYNEYLGRDYCPIPDIFIPDKNTVIEIYGDRWHMNPAIYKHSDIAHFFSGERSAAQIWEFDKNRVAHLQSFVDSVIIVWESDIKHNFEQVKNYIQQKLCIK